MPAASKMGCPFYWSRMQFCSLGSVINCFVLCILGCSAAYWPANNNISSTTKNVFIRCQMSLGGVEAELLGLGTKARIVVSDFDCMALRLKCSCISPSWWAEQSNFKLARKQREKKRALLVGALVFPFYSMQS